ncbi:DNA packaging protein [Afifella sp. YEN Y35]|uniref:DNA packaging protein n=1 Tax=Afifella sp. YEN Y35 TaxID=3388337 RepID=UPI0039E0B5AD
MQAAHSSTPLGEPKTLRKSDFAKTIGVSAGRVSQMVRDGLPVEADGRIDVARGRLWVRDNVDPRRAAAQAAQGEMPFAARPDAAAERARLAKEQADHAALRNGVLRRELVKAEEVEREWTNVLRRVRSRILAVPSRLRQARAHLSAADVAAIEAELRAALEELAHAE